MFILFGFLISVAVAQEKTILLTRTTEKSFTTGNNPEIIINAERGMINIKSWEKEEVKVRLKLIAKNRDVQKAREELDYMHYSISENLNSIYVNNRMRPEENDQLISSIIRAEYEITVPKNIEIHLDNSFGKVQVENIEGKLYGELYYSDMVLSGYSGELDLQIFIGDFTSENSHLSGRLITKHSNILISRTGGKLHMETQYGNLQLIYGEKVLLLNVISNASDIIVNNPLCRTIKLRIAGAYCPLKNIDMCYTPEKEYYKFNYAKNQQERWMLTYYPPEKASRLYISARFGTVSLCK